MASFGLLVATGLLLAFFVLRADLNRRRLSADPHTIIGLAGLAGLAGAKLYHVLESPSELMAHPLTLLFSREGFAWFGGLLAGLITLLLLARHYHIPMLQMLDAASPAAALGYGIGRLGCLVSGDGDYGIPTSLPWGMAFPNGLVPTTERVHPTPIYELLTAIVISYFLWRLGAQALRQHRPIGVVFAHFLLWTGVARFLVEFIRINPPWLFGLTNAQVASLLSFVAGIVLLLRLHSRQTEPPALPNRPRRPPRPNAS